MLRCTRHRLPRAGPLSDRATRLPTNQQGRAARTCRSACVGTRRAPSRRLGARRPLFGIVHNDARTVSPGDPQAAAPAERRRRSCQRRLSVHCLGLARILVTDLVSSTSSVVGTVPPHSSVLADDPTLLAVRCGPSAHLVRRIPGQRITAQASCAGLSGHVATGGGGQSSRLNCPTGRSRHRRPRWPRRRPRRPRGGRSGTRWPRCRSW